MKNHVQPHKNAQKHTKHTQKHKRTHNDDTSRVFGFGCDVGFDCGSCLGWTKHAGHVIPFAVQPMQEPQSKAISQPKPKNRDMSSCCVGATLPYLSRLRGGISKAEAPRAPQERSKSGQVGPKSLLRACPRGAKNHPKAPQSQPRGTKECPRPLYNQVQRASRPGSSAIFVGSFVRQAPGAIFYCFFVLCVTCTICENHRKTCVFPWFLRIGS